MILHSRFQPGVFCVAEMPEAVESYSSIKKEKTLFTENEVNRVFTTGLNSRDCNFETCTEVAGEPGIELVQHGN